MLNEDFNKMFLQENNDNTVLTALIFPIHKKGDIHDTQNLRELSFLNVCLKSSAAY